MYIFKRFLYIMCAFSLAVAYCQVAQQNAVTFKGQPIERAGRQWAELRNTQRFLGWKYARQSHQDARRWTRSNKQTSATVDQRSQSFRSFGQSPSTPIGSAGFLWRSSLPAGFIPTSICTGDFNEDGKNDFAISNGGDNSIYVFLGKGDGTFDVPEILYTQGQSPTWITSVRLHKSGHLDLVVTDSDSNSVEVFSGNGKGTFGSSTQTSVPQTPTFVLAADVNNDGNQDLVIGLTIAQDLTQPQFEVLLGNGSGGFSSTLFSPAIFGSPDGPVPTSWVSAGDVNNDGYVDIVTTVSGAIAIPYLNQQGKSFLLGNSFGPNNGAADAPLVVELGDMDQDGCLDAVETDVYSMVNIAKGTCDGNFPTSSPATPLGDFDPAIKVVDIDGDGHLDIVGSAVWYPNSGGGGIGAPGGYLVSVLKGDGHGNLGPATVYRGGTSAYSLIVADLNGDGKPEIITADSLENGLSLFINDGTGHFGNPQGENIGYVGGGPINAPNAQAPMEVADLNGDGKPDLLLVEDGLNCCVPSQLTTMLNDGAGKFLPAQRTPITVGDDTPVPRFLAGAFRTPAALDVIYINTYTGTNTVFNVAFFRSNGDGTFAAPAVITTLPNPEQFVAGDFNGDGKLDFAVMGTDSTGQAWEFDVFLGHGDGTFTQLPPQLFSMLGTDTPNQLFAVDLNHDGKLDVLIGLNANQGWVASGDDLIEALGNGDGTFQTPTVLFAHFGAVAVADVNRDGLSDLIQNRDPNGDFGLSGLLYQPGITVYLGAADGTFSQQPSYDLPGVALPSPNPALAGDFNGDGIPDIAVPYWEAPPPAYLIEPFLLVLQGVGDGRFIVTGHRYQLPGLSEPFVGADFNGDGAIDLVDLVGLSSSFTVIPAAPAPTVDIALDSSPILGNDGLATVTLNSPATTGEIVTLSASDPAIQLPASLHFGVGQQTQGFSLKLGSAFDQTHVFAIYATFGTQTASVFGTKPNPNLTVGVSSSLSNPLNPVSPNVSVEPGENFTINFGIASEGGYSGTYSAIQCNRLPSGSSCSFSAASMPILAGLSDSISVVVNTSSSTPFGMYTIAVSATDGLTPTESTFQLGIGDFSFAINPTTIVVGPSGNAAATITTSSTNGLNEPLNLTCSGLPANTQCGANGVLYTSASTMGFGIGHDQLAAADYPFQIVGTADIVSHTINAVLRVGDFTATLDKTTATLSAGQSGTFQVTLTSVNHYSNSITVFCDPSATTVTCSASPSPAALSDGGVTNVQLTVKDVSTDARHTGVPNSMNVVATMLFISGFVILTRRRTIRHSLAMTVLMFALGMASCGGSGSGNNGSGSGGTGGGGGSGTPKTVNISVVAQAASTPTDMSNQKILAPIVVTLQ